MSPTHSRPRHHALTSTILLAAAGALVAAPASGQDGRALDHADTYAWNEIEEEALSDDGRWVVYALRPYEGDATLVVRPTRGPGELRVARGTEPTFSADDRFLVVRVEPTREAEDSARAAGAEDDELPADSLVVVDLEASFRGGDTELEAVRIPEVKSFALPDDAGRVLAVHLRPASSDEGEGGVQDEDEEADPHEKPESSPLELRIPGTDRSWRYDDVSGYALSDDGSRLVYAAATEDGDGDGAFSVDTETGTASPLLTGEGIYTRVAVAPDARRAAFLSNRGDWESDDPEFTLFTADLNAGEAAPAADSETPGVPQGWWVSRHADVAFSDGGHRVFFGTRPRPRESPAYADTVPDHRQVSVDVWSWKDDYLQPMQKVRVEEEGPFTYRAVLHADDGRVVQLADREVPEVEVGRDGDADVALGTTDVPYRQELSWDGRYKDAYVVDVATGERRLVAEKVRGFGPFELSPEAGYVYWWDGVERHWFAAPTEGGDAVNLTAAIPGPVHDLHDDRPEPPGPYGSAGWTPDDGALVVYDRTDIWLVDPDAPGEPRNVTEGVGERENMAFRYVDVETDDDGDGDAVPLDRDVLITGFHRARKTHGVYRDRFGGDAEPTLLTGADARHYRVRDRAGGDDPVVLWSRESFREFPDLRISGPDFREPRRVSDANPQQDDFRWGSAEVVEWHSADGELLRGTLYTPDGFDPSKKYPMMVYFYERMSDFSYRYRDPSPGSSSIAFPFYVSRGYVLFVPDIPYEVPYPGESALDAVVPGVQSIARRGFVDRDRIGVQGHSWGGYQIAYMITKTDLFAAAEAGAPVVNMTSAYGGIRWGSGMSRMFQYERTQSRIGKSLWAATQEYLDNSPLFYVPKIKTPVMYMHNDDDGAVPWYQGIEFFVALRRLGKPAWMLNYNGEKHGLRQTHNQKDFAVRMQQFFDHYLKDAPPPVWMEEGVPAIEKGRTLGLELVGGTPPDDGGR